MTRALARAGCMRCAASTTCSPPSPGSARPSCRRWAKRATTVSPSRWWARAAKPTPPDRRSREMRIPPRLADRQRAPLRLLLAPVGPLVAWVERLAAIQAVDRGVALGALAFSSLFPLLIVYSAVAPTVASRDFAEGIVKRLALSGTAAQSVREVFAPSSIVAHSVTVIGFALVLFSALSLARALQRMYELAY